MKNLLIAITALFILNSCSKEIIYNINNYPQKWELVKSSGRGFSFEGKDLPYKETYELNKNNSFIKTRLSNGETQTATGTFTIEEIDNQRYFVFKYPTKNDLIGSCNSSELKEHLGIISNNKIFSTWQACDGPGLEYSRVE